MTTSDFTSILYFDPADAGTGQGDEPAFFGDLNLDQLVASMTVGRESYDLAPFFHQTLGSIDAILYRNEVMRDLEQEHTHASIVAFGEAMADMRTMLEQVAKRHYRYQKEAWFVGAAEKYCGAVTRLFAELDAQGVTSRAMTGFVDFLRAYTGSDDFVSLVTEIGSLRSRLGDIRYCVHLYGSKVSVSRFEDDPDYSAEVLSTFAKFKEQDPKNYLTKLSVWADMDHVEAQILDRVAKLYPDEFAELDDFCQRRTTYPDTCVERFDREVQFYLCYLEYITGLKDAGLSFCYATLSTDSKQEEVVQTFDPTLADKLVRERSTVVCNDFHLDEPERIFVVSGPNQGGKSTFARTFGQLHFLASLGLPVPGAKVQLFLFDQLFTHFERQEDVRSLHGKLEVELIRVHDILERATPHSVIIMNEIFTSTTLRDALSLGQKIMARLMELDVLCVYVTFVDELATFSDTTVSVVSEIIPVDPAKRTYKITRRPADGLAHAGVLADTYGLSYDRLKERIAS